MDWWKWQGRPLSPTRVICEQYGNLLIAISRTWGDDLRACLRPWLTAHALLRVERSEWMSRERSTIGRSGWSFWKTVGPEFPHFAIRHSLSHNRVAFFTVPEIQGKVFRAEMHKSAMGDGVVFWYRNFPSSALQ